MRIVVVNENLDRRALMAGLLRARLSADATESALASLQALNPHADLENLRSGSVLIIPSDPRFKVTGSKPLLGEPLDQFHQRVTTALKAMAEKLKRGARKGARVGRNCR